MFLPDREELQDWLKGKVWVLALAGIAGTWGIRTFLQRPVHPPPGMIAPDEPLQGPPTRTAAWTFRDHTFTALASFDITARVLSRERYRFDRAAELSPIDLALGWGPMSDSAVLDHVHIRQDGRWYYWSAAPLPLPAGEISSHSANMHMIPARPSVRDTLFGAREGQVVHLQGQLIEAEGKDRWKWRSSLTRTDTGDGACEVIWVESASIR